MREHAERVWRCMAVFAGDVDESAVRHVCEDPERRGLDELLEAGVVDVEETRLRYRLTAAPPPLGAAEEIEARRRHAQHFLTALGDAARWWAEGGVGQQDARSILDDDWANIAAAQAWAAAHMATDADAARLCLDYADVGASLLAATARGEAEARWRWDAWRAAQRLGDGLGEMRQLVRLGALARGAPDPAAASAHYAAALDLAQRLDEPVWQAGILGELSNTCREAGDAAGAAAHAAQQQALITAAADPMGLLASLGHFYEDQGNPLRAATWYEEAVQFAQAAGDPQAELALRFHALTAWLKARDVARALAGYAAALPLAEALRDQRAVGELLYGKAIVLWHSGEAEAAISTLTLAIAALGACDDPVAADARDLLEEWQDAVV